MTEPSLGWPATVPEADRAALLQLLDETPAFTLATLDPDGAPRATPLYFAVDRLCLVFLSDPSSQHCRNLQADPRCGAALYPTVADWRALRGLQMRGQARLLSEADAPQALRIYLQRFPFAAELAQAVDSAAAYRFRPGWVRRIDNRLAFGFQQEWELDE